MLEEYFSLSDDNCGPFFFPKFIRAAFSKHYNKQCYLHDISYREQKQKRKCIDKIFLSDMLNSVPNKIFCAYFFYAFVRYFAWTSWYFITLDNKYGWTKWGRKIKDDGKIM